MKTLLLLLLSLAAWAAPVITNQAVTNITAHGARFAWTTDVSSSGARILVGTSDPPTTSIVALGSGSNTTHVWFASGLTPGTLYYWQVCATNSGETCTASGTFTTLAAEPGIATPPTAPSTFSTTYPTIDGSTYNVASDCSDLQSQINTAAAQNGNLSHEVVIPAGAVCVGRYTLPAKTGSNPTGSGVIVIRGNATLPPEGARVSSDYASNFPTIISSYLYTYYQNSAPGSCLTGDIWIDADAASNWVNYCTATNTWTAKTVTAAAGAPSGSCTADAWYRNTSDATLASALYWCVATDTWRNVYVSNDSNYVSFAALKSAGSIKGYRIVGVKVQAMPKPSAYTDLISRTSGNGDELGPTSRCLAHTSSTDTNVIFDRVWWEGQGFPHRQQEAICFMDGTNIAVIDSYFNEINRWRPDSASESTTHAVFFLSGPGPAIIRNNYFGNVGGMAIFHSDDNPVGQTNDVTITRNDFYFSPTLNQREATSNGRKYYFRHHIELKRGQRWQIVGNTFWNGLPSANPSSAVFGITPRNGASSATQCRTNTIAVTDLDIRSNKILYAPQVLLLTGHNDSKNCNTYTTQRTRFSNNVVWTTGESETGNGLGLGSYTYNGQIGEIGLGLEDVIINNNILGNVKSGCTPSPCNAHMMTFGGDWSAYLNSRFQMENNIYWAPSIGTNWGIINGSGSGTSQQGTAGLNNVIEPNSTYSWAGNARHRNAGSSVVYPAGNYDSATLTDFTNSMYQCTICGDEAAWRPLYNSKFAAGSATARGYDRKDAGPDFVQFDADQGILYNQRALSITSSGATIHWTAPDASTACTVEYGTSATPGTGSRVTDTPTSRFRSRALTGLSSATTYYYRIYCGRMVSGSFRTN